VIVQQAMQKSKDGVAQRKDSKGQRWAVWMDGSKLIGYLDKKDGTMLPLTIKSAEMLKDWEPKDPKELSIHGAVRPKSKGPMWPK
jgi:hypothetical protein